MEHAHIVQAADLDRYCLRRESQAVIPELIYLLVKQSIPPPSVCRIPYGESVNQPGWDGVVEMEQRFLEYVPEGISYWEIGTDSNPQVKATKEFSKRTAILSDAERAESSFVFVTPRSSASGGWDEPKQTSWLRTRKDKGWKHIRIIDGVKLADWLREWPALGRGMAKKIGLTKSLGGMSTPAEHWDLLLSESTSNDPPLPPKLFTTGRKNACEALQSLFNGKKQNLMMFAESPQDVADFVAGFLFTLDPEISRDWANRCLYIKDEEAWRSIAETRSPHVLVADPRLGLELDENADLRTLARRRGHAVITPLCGAWSGGNPEILKLQSPSRSQIEEVLREVDYPEGRARELARVGGDMISALRRHLRGLGNLPPYATWESATLIAQAGLAGKWTGTSPADRAALEKLLGKAYGEWIEKLRPDALRSDSPLIQQDEKWRFLARGEAWDALGNRITDADLERFEEMAVMVLGERDPRFDLPKEERYAASVHGKVLQHSRQLRKGLAETLALLGSRPNALSSCSTGKADITALLVVRKLLSEATWDRWASLDCLLPLIAEAAPDEFLDAVEAALKNLENTLFHQIFAEEGGGIIGGGSYMCGLLWALETLAWEPVHLSRVSVILSDLASIDPGGNMSNRPGNSLADIFLPWHFQTVAPFKKRKDAVVTVLREHPDVGWALLLSLLPHNHGFTSGCHRPTWRNYIPQDWNDGVLRTEYWEQVTDYTELAVGLAKEDTAKLGELIDRLSDLPQAAHESLLRHLGSSAILELPEGERLPLWEKLDSMVRHHRKFAGSDWALSEEILGKIEVAANALAPNTSKFKYRHLFSDRDFDLYDEKGDYDAQRRRLDAARQAATQEILNKGSLAEVLEFTSEVKAPYEVGRALGAIASGDLEDEVLPALLAESVESPMERLVAGFVWVRYWERQWEWVDDVLARGWEAKNKAAFLIRLPFEDKVWIRVTEHLGSENEKLYWEHAWVNSYGPERDLTLAIEKLLQFDRPIHALACVARTADSGDHFNEPLAIRALLAVLDTPTGIERLNNYDTVNVITRLQQSKTPHREALFRIEWCFLPWLDRFSTGSPVTLEKQLAGDPSFFAEVIGVVYRSKNEKKRPKEEPDEQKQHLAKNGYKLLDVWRRVPGKLDDGSFDVAAFETWITESLRITRSSGHWEVAQIQIGHVLTRAPQDPGGLWIHEAVAKVLNQRDLEEMRSGFTIQLSNDRGVHAFTAGEEERELARNYRERAEALDAVGYSRFATAMRELAERYDRDAERESKRDPFRD
jgi:hypothetical protein